MLELSSQLCRERSCVDEPRCHKVQYSGHREAHLLFWLGGVVTQCL